MPTLYRLTKLSRAPAAFSGEGARLFGGRWNSPGVRVVYTSATRSLALLETLVHLDTSLPLPQFAFLSIDLADDDIEWLPRDALARRNDPAQTSALGDRFIKSVARVAFAVPSVIVPTEFNYLLNPIHLRFATLKRSTPELFHLDNRLRPPQEPRSSTA